MQTSEPLQSLQARAEEAAARGETGEAVELALVIVRGAAQQQDPTALALAQSFVARHAFFLGRFPQTLDHGRQAVAAWRQLGRPDKECEALAVLALTLSEIGSHDQGLDLAQRALTLARQHGEDICFARVLGTCGALQARVGDEVQGEATLMHALSLSRDHNDLTSVLGITNALLSLQAHAHASHLRQGRSLEAQAAGARLLHTARKALAMRADLKHVFERVVVQGNAAAALLSCGEVDEALDLLRTTARQAQQAGLRVAWLRVQTRLAQALLHQGDLAGAASALQALHEALAHDEHAAARLECIQLQADLAQARGDAAGAAAYRAQVQAAEDQRQAFLAEVRSRHRDYPDSLSSLPAP